MIDYKNKAIIPPEPTITEKVQVHLYRKALVESGYEGNIGLLIVYMDYINKEPVPKPVDYDGDLEMQIIEAGNDVWQHVLNDTKPRFDRKNSPILILSEEAKEIVGPLEEQLARAKVIAEAAKKAADALQEKLTEILEAEVGAGLLKSFNIPLKMLSSTVRQTIIEPELETLLAAQKTPAQISKKMGKTLMKQKSLNSSRSMVGIRLSLKEKVYDLPKVLAFCLEKELTPPIRESFSVSLKASKPKNITKDDIELTKEKGDELVASILPDVLLPNEDNDLDHSIGPRL